MQIRNARKGDHAAIATIFGEAMSQAPYRVQVRRKSVLDSIAFYLKNYDVRVASIEGDIVGFIAVFKYQWIDSTRLWVGELHVHPDHQRKGIGKKLLNQVIRDYRSKGVKHIELLAHTKAPAMRFYKHRGFQKSPQVKLERKI